MTQSEAPKQTCQQQMYSGLSTGQPCLCSLLQAGGCCNISHVQARAATGGWQASAKPGPLGSILLDCSGLALHHALLDALHKLALLRLQLGARGLHFGSAGTAATRPGHARNVQARGVMPACPHKVVWSAQTGTCVCTCTCMPFVPTREAVTEVRQGMNQLAMRSPSALHRNRWATH